MNIKNKEIINGDCLEIMKEFSDKCFDVSFTSPPYNRKRNDTYAKFNDVKDDYFDFLCKVTKELLRCTKGSVIINLQSNMYNKIDVAKWQGEFAEYIKGIVIWTKQNPIPSWNYKKDKDVYSVTNGFEYFFVLPASVFYRFFLLCLPRRVLCVQVATVVDLTRQHFYWCCILVNPFVIY